MAKKNEDRFTDDDMLTLRKRIGGLFYDSSEVIISIVKNLYHKDLYNASLVNHTWNRICKKYMTLEQVDFTFNGFGNVKSPSYFYINSADSTKLMFCLTFMDIGVYDRHWYFLKETHSKVEYKALPKYKQSMVHYRLKQCMNSTCESILINRPSRCIDYIDPDYSQTLDRGFVGYVTFAFPYIPGVKIQPFELLSDEKNVDIFSKYQIDTNLKFILIIGSSPRHGRITNHILNNVNSEKHAIYEIMNNNCRLNDAKIERDFLFGMAISGESVTVSSIQSEDALPSLKQENKIYKRHNTFALLFHKIDFPHKEFMSRFADIFGTTPFISIEWDNTFSFNPAEKIIKLEEGKKFQLTLISWQ